MKENFQEMIETSNATHVIVEIDYGMKAVFDFSRKKDVCRREETVLPLKHFIKKIKARALTVGFERPDPNCENIKCDFTSNVDKNPTTYEEAVDDLKKITREGSSERTIPTTVRLLPVQFFYPQLNRRLRLDKNIIGNVLRAYSELEEISKASFQLEQSSLFSCGSVMKERLNKLKAMKL